MISRESAIGWDGSLLRVPHHGQFPVGGDNSALSVHAWPVQKMKYENGKKTGWRRGTNKPYFIFVCLSRKFLEITDDIAIGKMREDHKRDGSRTVAQSKDLTNVYMDDTMGNLDVRMEALQETLW